MSAIQTFAELSRYRAPFSEIDSSIVDYQGKKLPQVKARIPDKKDGGSLERTVNSIGQRPDGNFVIDGRVAEPFKPQYDASKTVGYHPAQEHAQEYQQPPALRNDEDSTALSHQKLHEMAQHDAFKNMGFVEGNGRHYTPAEKEKRKHRNYARMSPLLTQMEYSGAFN
ncbi:hypothetical protein HYV81_01410 [Candidatus Woesearchaeota archaeon]|nr:hypothetical protein [Candidatus Woesearchaeota archaeon]